MLAAVGEPSEALEAIARTRRHRITVLVSLAVQDETDGAYELIRDLRERHPSVGVLAMGADSDAATISRALFVGADGYVDKRSAPEDFCGAFVSAADHLMVLIGSPGEALGRVAEALIQRREVEGRLTVREREVLEVAAEGLTARADRRATRASVSGRSPHTWRGSTGSSGSARVSPRSGPRRARASWGSTSASELSPGRAGRRRRPRRRRASRSPPLRGSAGGPSPWRR